MQKANTRLCDSFVYQYLVENGQRTISNRLLKSRKKCANISWVKKLDGWSVTEILSCLLTEVMGKNAAQNLSDTVVYNFFKSHKKPEVQMLAKKLKKRASKKGFPINLENKDIPTLKELLNNGLKEEEVPVPTENPVPKASAKPATLVKKPDHRTSDASSNISTGQHK